MRPNRHNEVFCPDCGRYKMRFDTERKARDFIRWNGNDIMEEHPDVKTLRPYYCPACCCWHISSKSYWDGYDKRTDNIINAYKRDIKNMKAMSGISGLDIATAALSETIREKGYTCYSGEVRKTITAYFKEHPADSRTTNRTYIYFQREYKYDVN